MIPSAYPEANRLAYRIRTALTGESTGLETAKLAWQQAEAVSRANVALADAAAALDNGSLLDALLIEGAYPTLLDTARSLEHTFVSEWKKRCETYHWRVADPVDMANVSKIQDAIDSQGDLKDWLFKQYRSAVRSKDSLRAYQIIDLLAHRFPDDENAKQEFATKRGQLVEQAASDVKDALEQLIPNESPAAVVKRYLALGLPLSDSTHSHLKETLSSASSKHVDDFAASLQTAIEAAAAKDFESNWQEIEKDYLACEYRIAINEARGTLPPELRAELEGLATRLSRIRSQFESNISIRLAIAEVREGRTHKGKPVPLGNRIAKLRSLETQATKTGSQVPPELQAEIKAAYAFARRKRLPLLAGAAAIAALLIFGGVTFFQRKAEQEEIAQMRSDALAALQETERSGRTDQVRQSLETWSEPIANAQPESPLANQASLLRDWLEMQASLENQYNESVEELETIATSRNALENEDAIKELAAQIRRARTDLAPDLGSEADSKFATLLNQFNNIKAAAQEQDRQELARLEKELRTAATNAAQAQSRVEFERLQTAAESRIVSLNSLLQSDSVAQSRNQLQPLIQSAAQQLATIETKWNALDDAWLRLSETKELAPYLAQLERIHSFDILPAEKKNAISQTLRLKTELQSLDKSQPLFANETARAVFSGESDYLAARVELSEEERAYIARLQNSDTFTNVYQSTVQYFEGSAEPQSEYRIYLVEPIAKSDSQEGDSHVTFTFSVRGYDELGQPEPQPRQIQFISREDGSFWGFFYKPSKLSPESEYFNTSISNTLSQLLAGSDRLAVVKLLEDLATQDQLSPAFRIYWQQQLIGFMELYPWKWGLALSPALQKRATELDALASGELSESIWLSTIEQTVPSPAYDALAKRAFATAPSSEITTLADLYQKAASGAYVFAGHVLEDGKPDLATPLPEGTQLWSVNALTGSIEATSSDRPLTPYAPLLHYHLSDGEPPSEILRKAAYASGLSLNEAPYRSLLPTLYQ